MRLVYRLAGEPFTTRGVRNQAEGWQFETEAELFKKVKEVFGDAAIDELKRTAKFERTVSKKQIESLGKPSR